MSLKKIEMNPCELPKPCRALDHSPPTMMVYQPGTYAWTRPSCGQVTTFVVNRVTL